MRNVSRRALGAAAVALLLTAGVAGAAAPAGPRLAVVKQTWRPYRVTLLTVDPHGRAPMRLAGGQENDGPVEIFAPLSWRPDGAELAFPGLLRFFLARADRRGARPVNAGGAENPVFAPDGHTIAFTRSNRYDQAEIWTIDLTTWEQRQLTPSRRGLIYEASSFSPDGSTLLATRVDRNRTGAAEPVALHLDTGGATRLLADGLKPIFSPDGSQIALFRKVGKREVNDLFVIDTASGSLRRLTRTRPGYELFASWDPSGERIAFVRFRGRHFEWANSVVQINADGTCETEVLPLKRRTVFYGIAWQPGPGREAGRIDC